VTDQKTIYIYIYIHFKKLIFVVFEADIVRNKKIYIIICVQIIFSLCWYQKTTDFKHDLHNN